MPSTEMPSPDAPSTAVHSTDGGWAAHSAGPLLALGNYLKEAEYRFVTVTPATHARVNNRPGNELGSSLVELFGWNRPFVEESIDPDLFGLMREADILLPCSLGWRSRLRAATLGDELYFHSAFPTSDPDSVFFGPDSYRFAALLEQELGWLGKPPRRVVDIGCGAGPGALTVARALAGHGSAVIAADINPIALALCRINAALARTAIECKESNLLHQIEGEFDLIVANPPYLVDGGERAYRHGGGALGGALSLAIVETALDRLAAGGTLVLYTGSAVVNGVDALHDEIALLLDPRDGFEWRYRELDPDIFGEELEEKPYLLADRIAAVALTLTRCG